MLRPKGVAVTALMVIAALVVGCGDGDDGAATDPSESTGTITFEDYERAYYDFISCLEASGIHYHELGLDPELRIFMYETEGASVELERSTGTIPSDECYFNEFEDADSTWQIQQREASDFETFNRLLECLKSRDVPDPPEEYLATRNSGGLIEHALESVGPSFLDDFERGQCP